MPGEVLATVFLLDATYWMDKGYDYRVPEPIREEIQPGVFVLVPFGGGNRRQLAVVWDLREIPVKEGGYYYKPVLAVLDRQLQLNEEMRRLCAYLKEHTFCTVGDAVKAVLPACAFSKWEEYYARTTIPLPEKLPQRQILILRAVEEGDVAQRVLRGRFGAPVIRDLESLVNAGYLRRTLLWKEQNRKYLLRFYLAVELEDLLRYTEGDLKLRSKKQIEVLQTIADNPGMSLDEIHSMGLSENSLKTLVQKGILRTEKQELYRTPYDAPEVCEPSPLQLNEEQQAAYDTLLSLYLIHMPRAALLYGVTGSGKTQVIRAMMDRVLADGKQVILMVPEIALTPQTMRIFLNCYGKRVTVLHSGLSLGERYDAWRKMKNGEVDICIGTRSAVFAPFDRLGLIVMDEEQEHTYKSDSNPKFHARDVARLRCTHQKALLLLASATPSIESYYKTESGSYTLIPLTHRYGDAALPDTNIVDLRNELRQGRRDPVGTVLAEALRETKADGNQSILFLNRRGYHATLTCPSCAEPLLCPHCSVALTYHRGGGTRGQLRCHYCGYRIEVPKNCPSCQYEHLVFQGFGTQQVEESLCSKNQDLKVMRMDADTTVSKFAYDEMLDGFRKGNADVLLGTQMVTKGHDFPNVTLVGVLNADQSLYLNDYRSNEKTFSLLTQVIGRAGRGKQYGRAIIQTCHPDHPILQLAASQDYEAFYRSEIALRKAMVFPPFCDLAVLFCAGKVEVELLEFTKKLFSYMKEFLEQDFKDVKVAIFGPMEAPLYKVNDKYRLRFVIKCRMNQRTREWMREVLKRAGEMTKKISVSVDINPSST